MRAIDIVKTMALLRQKVWFAKMDALVESKIKMCLNCHRATPAGNRQPLKMSELSKGPWEEISVGFRRLLKIPRV